MELRIVEAAIAVIEKDGTNAATVRRIAQKAGVNIAAINYYFRSKEQLMDRVMEVTLSNGFDWSHFESSDTFDPKQRLKAILTHLTEGSQLYPQISRMHFIEPILQRDAGSTAFVMFSQFLDRLYEDLVSRGAQAGTGLRYTVIQAISASLIGVGIMGDLLGGFAGTDLKTPESRDAYIDQLVEGIL
jgi:AcrR family transcriptional regulator